ncbi:hypothetical protein P3X46_009262 [Hevea brasiliensis]|uniref:C2H2-type domain-containing protein n=1 Tax=Hevea brasiliensis TaxID=3981 RepID=A0ABQ9MLA8_HEVBR|nr:hypothetical protein P3X46_009262 [Hevea brasiliensis]
MGTLQFPDLDKHCTREDCSLPFTCDCCRQDITVVICPLCAKGVRLNPDEDPNISWETHVNAECDPSNYDKVTKKRKCPVCGCGEVLAFANTIKCRDCNIDHCLKHRLGPDHDCPGPKKLEKESNTNQIPALSSTKWATAFRNAASTVQASAEAGVAKLSIEISQAWHTAKNGAGLSSSNGREAIGLEEKCPQCGARFSSVTVLAEHVQKVHARTGNQSRLMKLPVDVCPRCSRGFHDPVALVEHVERDHGGTSKA